MRRIVSCTGIPNGYRTMGFAALMAAAALIILVSPGGSDNWLLDPLNGIMAAVIALTMIRRLALGLPTQISVAMWSVGIAAVLGTCVVELSPPEFDPLLESLHLDDIASVFMWLATPIGFLVISRFERIPRLVRLLFGIGFALQTTSMLTEVFDTNIATLLAMPLASLELASDFTEFSALQLYLGAFSMLLLYAYWAPVKRPAPDTDMPLGLRTRAIFDQLRLFDRARFPKQQIAHFAGIPPLVEIGRTILWMGSLAPRIKREFGKSIGEQWRDILVHFMKDGLDAQAYYMYELYRPERAALASEYLTRYETKNGLMKALNGLLPKAGHRSALGDKAAFSARCRDSGVAAAPTIAVATSGKIDWRDAGKLPSRTGIFIKPSHSKGAAGTEAYHRQPDGSYQTPARTLISENELIAHIEQRSMVRPIIVQELLFNHASLADLAVDSLIVIRVFTALGEGGQPVVTHGMLRILAKLEPTWPTNAEFGVAVDLATGRLGLMATDKRNESPDFYDRHPITGAQILGRTLAQWPDVMAVALSAHAMCQDRQIIGWDVAITEQGVRLIEGNGYPDVVFLQRVHRVPVGKSPLGPILNRALDRLQQQRRTAA